MDSVIPVSLATLGALGLLTILKKLGLIYRLFHKTDPNSTRHGGEIVASVLKAHGVEHVFTLVGGHISPILVGCEKEGIRVIDTRHEVTTVYAADAVSRLTGKLGVAAVTAGPGLTNTVTALKNAQMAESAVLLLGGAAATLLKGRGALQDIDQMALFKPICKFTATVSHVREIAPTLRKAIQIARSGTPGPVFIEFPVDTLYPYQLIRREAGIVEKAKGFQKIVNLYLENYMANLYAGAWEEHDLSPLPIYTPFASKSQVQKCAELVSKAKSPLILMGSQSMLLSTPASELKKSLELLGVPCYLGGMSRGLLGRNSSLHIRQRRRDALKEADLVILAGCVCDFRLNYGRVLSRKCKIIAINRSKEQLYKNSDMFWKPTLAIQADVSSTLQSIQKSLPGYQCDASWLQKLKERDNEKESVNASKANEETDVHLNPIKVICAADEVMNENSIIIADGGDFVATASYILRPNGPLTWLDPGAFGTLGVGAGFAIGAKVCNPESEVWIIYGDGALGYSLVEFDTFQRFNLPVIALVGNDAAWMQIKRDQEPIFKSSVACNLEFSDYETAVKAFGCDGIKLDRTNEKEMKSLMENAQETCRNGKAVLINALIGRTNFREGSLSV